MSAPNPETVIAEAWAEIRASYAIGFVAEVQPETAELLLNERDALLASLAATTAERDAQEKVLSACARLLGDDMPAWAPLPVWEIGCSRCEAAEAALRAATTERDEAARWATKHADRIEALKVELRAANQHNETLTRALECIADIDTPWLGVQAVARAALLGVDRG